VSNTIQVTDLSKWFGPKVAVSEVTIGFSPGVTGLLGPNGAGKTTLMRVIAGLQVPSQGSVSILDKDPRQDPSIYRQMTLVPEDEAVYDHLTGRQFVELSARLAKVPHPRQRAQETLETVELTGAADRALGGYSKGMKQRAKVAAALVPDPQVLLLDEPLNGADPVQRAQLIGLFKELGAAGRTVIVSSHVLREVERMADTVIAMVDGRLAAVGTIATIRAAMTDKPRQVFVDCSDPRALAAELIGTPNVIGVHVNGEQLMIEATDVREVALQLPGVALRRELEVSRIEPADESLESVFRYLVEGR